MKVNSVGAGAKINMGVISRRMVGGGDGSDHDNGVRAHGKPDSFRSDFRSLLRAVKSGDMTSAQSALDTIKTDVAAASATYSPASTSASSAGAVSTDLKALFDAVGSGDASAAQSALATFVSDRRDAWRPQTDSSSTATVSSPDVQGHQGRRFYDLKSVIASLFSDSSSAPSTTDTSSTAPTDSTSTDSVPSDSTSTDSTSAETPSATTPADTTTPPVSSDLPATTAA